MEFNSVFKQQQHRLTQMGITNKNPRQKLLDDLQALVETWNRKKNSH
jgi:hypothetical protein